MTLNLDHLNHIYGYIKAEAVIIDGEKILNNIDTINHLYAMRQSFNFRVINTKGS